MKRKRGVKELCFILATCVVNCGLLFGVDYYYNSGVYQPMGTLIGDAGLTALKYGKHDAESAIKDDGVFTILVDELGVTLNPVAAATQGETLIADLVFEPLGRRNGDGVMQLILANHVAHDVENQTMTITIRDDVFFSDGTPLTIADVEGSLILAMLQGKNGTEGIAGREAFLGKVAAKPEGISILDEQTLVIQFEHMYLENEQILEVLIQKLGEMPYGQTDLVTFATQQFRHGVGTNAYQVDQAVQDQAILIANVNYREPIGDVDVVHVYNRQVINANELLENRLVDYIAFGTRDTILDTFLVDDGYDVYSKNSESVLGLVVNPNGVPVKYRETRKAIMYGLNRAEILPELYWYHYAEESSILPSNAYTMPLHIETSNLSVAKTAYEQAKEDMNMSDYYLNLPIIEGNVLYETVAENVKEQLEAVGFQINIHPKEMTAYIDTLYLSSNYDIFIDELTLPYTEDAYYEFAWDYFSEAQPVFEQIFTNIAKAVTEEEKALRYRQAEELMQEKSLFIPMVRGQNFIAMGSVWENYSISPYSNAPIGLHMVEYIS